MGAVIQNSFWNFLVLPFHSFFWIFLHSRVVLSTILLLPLIILLLGFSFFIFYPDISVGQFFMLKYCLDCFVTALSSVLWSSNLTKHKQAGKGGELTHDETTIIAGALELSEKTASDAMTPISETFAIDINSKLDRFGV